MRVVVQAPLRLGPVLDTVVQVVEDGLQGILEATTPVDSSPPRRGRAGSIHPVHAVGADQGIETLCGLLNSLVEGLAWRVTAFTEDFVLGEEHAVNAAHEAAALAVEVGIDFLLERGLVKVAGADGNTKSDGLLLGFASHILVDRDGRVDAAALTEESADGTPRALGRNQDNVNVRGNVDFGLVLEDGGETVREVEGLWRGQSAFKAL